MFVARRIDEDGLGKDGAGLRIALEEIDFALNDPRIVNVVGVVCRDVFAAGHRDAIVDIP